MPRHSCAPAAQIEAVVVWYGPMRNLQPSQAAARGSTTLILSRRTTDEFGSRDVSSVTL